MRTTLTLEDDVAQKLRTAMRRSGKSFKDTVNEYLRIGLNTRLPTPARKRFRVQARSLGLRPGLSYDDVQGLLDHLDTPPRQ